MDRSTDVPDRMLSVPAVEFQNAALMLAGPATPSFALAELNSLLSRLSPTELRDAVAAAPVVRLEPFLANYVAAMVETACARCALPVPAWTRDVAPLAEPVFGSTLVSLRVHLLTQSPAAFRSRNIFIDATLGDRV